MREGKEKNIRELTLIRVTRGMITIKLICPMHASQYDFCQNRSGSWFPHRRSIDSSAIKSFSSTSARWKISRHSFYPSRNRFHDLNGRQDGKEKIRLFFLKIPPLVWFNCRYGKLWKFFWRVGKTGEQNWKYY